MELMEAKKIRRVPVVDSRGVLVGIVAQADIARHESRKEVGELVRDVSKPDAALDARGSATSCGRDRASYRAARRLELGAAGRVAFRADRQ